MKTKPIDKIRTLEEQQRLQDPIFQPTSFWEHASAELLDCIERNDIRNFRRDKACLSYFVPTYGYPGLSLPEELHDKLIELADTSLVPKHRMIVENFLRGHYHALADFKAIKSAQDNSKQNIFKDFCESDVGNPIEQFNFDGKIVSRPSQNYMLGLVFLLNHNPHAKLSKVVEIGGGHGALAELLFKSKANTTTYINFDIPPTCVYADFYLSQSIPEHSNQSVADPWISDIEIELLKGAFVRPNWDVSKLHGSIDLFVNFHSFQEMEPHVTQRYIKEVKRWKPEYLLLRNIKEGKQLATNHSAGVEVPTTSADYENWLKDQYTLIDSDSLTYGFVTADNFHSEICLWRKK